MVWCLKQSQISEMFLPPRNAATVCGSAAPYRQLWVSKRTENNSACSFFSLPGEAECDRDLQLMDVIIFNVHIEVVFLQQAVHA